MWVSAINTINKASVLVSWDRLYCIALELEPVKWKRQLAEIMLQMFPVVWDFFGNGQVLKLAAV